MAVVLCAPVVFGQTVEFRIVERTGQTQVTPLDNEVNLAVQARVTGRSLSGFSFDIRIAGEAESQGTLERGNISNTDGTYDPGLGVGATVGRSGLARQYSYFGALNASFNGLINQSAGTFTNTADQEIGLVTGFVSGSPLLGTPGIDTDGDGNPDTWSGNGLGVPPVSGATAGLNPTAGALYFASEQFVDVYRFRYTASDLSGRVLHFQLGTMVARQFTQFVYGTGQWGAQSAATAGTAITSSGLNIEVIPAPAGACVLGLAGLVWARRRR
jgi:hypothetical protein